MNAVTRPPLKFFFWLSVSLLFTTYLLAKGMVVWGAAFYGIFGIISLYWIVSNKDCHILLSNEVLEIAFHRTFWKKKIFLLKDIDHLKFIKGDTVWESFFIMNKVERYYRSHDKLILVSGESQQEILINTNSADLKLLIDHFNRSSTSSSDRYSVHG